MAYFTKEIYERKREHAYNVSCSGIELISEQTGIDVDDLEVIEKLSHLRHELHSTRGGILMQDYMGKQMREIGSQFSDCETLASKADKLHLIDTPFPTIDEVEITDDESSQEIFDYFGEDVPDVDDEDDLRNYALDRLSEGYSEAINDWSSEVRKWFHEINEKYGTEFPSSLV